MRNSIKVLRYQDALTDKIWAVSCKRNADDTFDVWFGRTSDRVLRHRLINCGGLPEWETRLQAKLAKGYVLCEELTVDRSLNRLSRTENKTTAAPVSHTDAIFYHLYDAENPFDSAEDPLDSAHPYFTKIDSWLEESDYAHLFPMFVFENINCLLEYTSGLIRVNENPIGVLLLFGLQRYLNSISTNVCLSLATDNGELLEGGLADNKTLFFNACSEFMQSDEYKKEFEGVNFDVFNSRDDLLNLAVHLGCIPPMIDLNLIQSSKSAAYF